MSRNYGSLGRRSGSAAWQWIIIGLIMGLACSATLVLGAVATGVLNVSGAGAAFGPTNTPIIITATQAPVTPTPIPTEVIVTPTEEVDAQIEAPTATPTTDPASLTPQFTNTPIQTATPAVPTQAGGGETTALSSAAGDSAAPPDALLRIASELVDVEGGAFSMGTTPAEAAVAVRDCTERDGGACVPASAEDSYPQHTVQVSPFRIEESEVTYEQFVTYLNILGPGEHARGCGGQPCLATRSESDTSNVTYDSANYDIPDVINRLPVVEVTWFGAKAYCEAIGRRLPTEAEWERAARGNDGRVYPWGPNWDATLAWTNRSAPEDAEEGGPLPVDSLPLGASPFGAVNMAGNVAEWVSDWYDERFYYQAEASQPDPIGPPLGDQKVVRGGSWDAVPFFSRTMHRQSRRPGDPTPWIGFRCAADIEVPGANPTTTQPIGAAPISTPDPAALGVNPASGDEGDLGNSAPTLRPAATQPPAPTSLPGAQPTVAGTLIPS